MNFNQSLLNISKETARTPFEAHAHEGLAQTLQHLKSPNLREAYLHASQALKIEEDLQGSEERKLRNLAIKLADKIILEG
jgi:hypothetical protein